MDAFQFYPSPDDLVAHAWSKFKNRDFVRVLESSAGEGHLARGASVAAGSDQYRNKYIPVDVCEIDVTKHAILREQRFNVVGLDFLQFANGAIYSHIIMNPPFSDGAKHVLKAWDILYDGEVVAIINAETLKNQFSRERQALARLLEQHGSVEFMTGAFADAERKTDVEIAVVHLIKKASSADLAGSILKDLQQDAEMGAGLAGEYREENAVVLPNTFIESTVLAFNAAVRATRDAVLAEARAGYYTTLLGKTLAERCANAETNISGNCSVEWVRKQLSERYATLKDRAWTSILRSTQVTSKLSSGAQQRLEADFANIKTLEFTVSNVYGFLNGLVAMQGQIQMEMVLDVFDLISKYHTEGNSVFYKGWKSNDRHRTQAMRIKGTRFVLPGFTVESHNRYLPHHYQQRLADLDKVFSMLDAKAAPEYGLCQLFDAEFSTMRVSQRRSSSYFDVRWYPGAGTIHFFPRSQELMDKLNRLVGRHRKWLPQEGEQASESFWTQYDKADKFDKEVRAEINRVAPRSCGKNHPLEGLSSSDQENVALAAAAVDKAVLTVLESKGISMDFQLEAPTQQQLLLAA